MTNEELELRKLRMFNDMLSNLNRALYDFFSLRYINLEKCIKIGILDFRISIMDNIEKFSQNISNHLKDTEEYKKFKERYQNLLVNLAAAKDGIKEKFYNLSLIDAIMTFELVPYQQDSITRLLFSNYVSEDFQREFLDEQCNKLLNNGKDFRIINSLDKANIEPEKLQSDSLYQLLINNLVIKYVKYFDKYKVNKKSGVDVRYIIRMICRHQNRGYYIPNVECRDAIIKTYAYNCWFKELRHMIKKNTIGITKENYLRIVELINNAFLEMIVVNDLTEGMTIDLRDKFDEMISLVCEVVEEEFRLIRREV